MTFNHVTRRLHLYLAMSLLPWFLMYAASSVSMSHHGWIGSFYDDKAPQWSLRLERAHTGGTTIDRSTDRDGRMRFAEGLLAELGITGRFGVNAVRPDGVLEIWCPNFRAPTRVRYNVDSKRVRVEDKLFRWDHFLGGMHGRAGFGRGFLDNVWAVIVDAVSLAFLLWIATGLYMWWKLPRLRRWGLVSLLGGIVTFTGFVFGL